MKRQILVVALSTLFGVGAAMAAPQDQEQAPPAQNGQSAQRHRPDPQHQAQMLTKRLKLSSDQQNQVLAILNDQQQQMQNLRADNSLSRQDRFAKMRTIREDSQNKIKAVLTDSQKQTYDQMLQKMQQRREQRQQDRQGNQ